MTTSKKRDWLFCVVVVLLLPILLLDGKTVFWMEPLPYLWVVLKSQQLAYAALVGVLGFALFRHAPLKHSLFGVGLGLLCLPIPLMMLAVLSDLVMGDAVGIFATVLYLPRVLPHTIEIALLMAFGLLVWFLLHQFTVRWRAAAFPTLPSTEKDLRVPLALAAKVRLAVVSVVGVGLGAGAGAYWLAPKIQYVETEMRVNGMLAAAWDLGILENSPTDEATRKLKDSLVSNLEIVQGTSTQLPAQIQDVLTRRQGLGEPVGQKQ